MFCCVCNLVFPCKLELAVTSYKKNFAVNWVCVIERRITWDKIFCYILYNIQAGDWQKDRKAGKYGECRARYLQGGTHVVMRFGGPPPTKLDAIWLNYGFSHNSTQLPLQYLLQKHTGVLLPLLMVWFPASRYQREKDGGLAVVSASSYIYNILANFKIRGKITVD